MCTAGKLSCQVQSVTRPTQLKDESLKFLADQFQIRHSPPVAVDFLLPSFTFICGQKRRAESAESTSELGTRNMMAGKGFFDPFRFSPQLQAADSDVEGSSQKCANKPLLLAKSWMPCWVSRSHAYLSSKIIKLNCMRWLTNELEISCQIIGRKKILTFLTNTINKIAYTSIN